jgi:hypothetical protein
VKLVVRNLGPAGTFTTVFWRYLLNFDSDINSGYLIYVATWFGGRVCKKGAKIEGSLAWLKRNIDRNLQNLGDIALYVWLGTCNLTSKDKSRFISLSSQNNETLCIPSRYKLKL